MYTFVYLLPDGTGEIPHDVVNYKDEIKSILRRVIPVVVI